MANLNIPTVELVSTLRAAPENGVTNSQDYNDSWTESLADLASLSGFLNDVLIPMLDGLSSNIQPNPQSAPGPLEGRFIFGDTTDQSSLFYDNLSNAPLSMADSLRLLNGIVNATQAAIQNINVEITAIQTQLSSTNQNDIAQALQNFAAALESLTAQTNSNTQQISAVQTVFETNGTQNPVQSMLNIVAGTGITVTNPADSGDVVISNSAGTINFENNGTPNSSQTTLNLTAGVGATITDMGGGAIRISAGGGAGGSRTTASITTGSLAPNGTQNQSTAGLYLSKSFVLFSVQVNHPCRVELYQTAAAQAADASRPAGSQPAPGLPNGVILDLDITPTIFASYPTFALSPSVIGANMETSPSDAISYQITNIDTVARAITVTFTFVPLEA